MSELFEVNCSKMHGSLCIREDENCELCDYKTMVRGVSPDEYWNLIKRNFKNVPECPETWTEKYKLRSFNRR